jgi:hypothetical protein
MKRLINFGNGTGEMKKGQASRPNDGMTCPDNRFKIITFTGDSPY